MVETETKVQRYEHYKDSGVEWLGEIPEHWDLGRLGSILNPVSSKNHPNETLLSITREKGVIVRDMENEDENHNFIPDDLTGYKLLKEGQFGMNKMKAWQGSYGVSSFTGIVSPAYYTFEFTKEIEPRFFHIAIRSKLYVSFFGKASDGVRIGQWDLSKDRMKRIPLAIPPLPEQTAIAEFLDHKTTKIDEAISIKEQQINLLKERKQIFIQKAVTHGLNPTAKLRDSGVEWLGKIPEHWEMKKMKFISEIFNGDSLNESLKKKYESDDLSHLAYVSTKNINVNNSVITYNTGLRIPKDGVNLKVAPKNSCLLCIEGGSAGRKIAFTNQEVCFVNKLACFSVKKGYDSKYLFFSLKGSPFQTQFKLSMSGMIGGVAISSINNFSIPIPPLKEQKEISEYIDSISLKIETAINLKQKEIEKLKEYKSSLINSVVTGKVKVC